MAGLHGELDLVGPSAFSRRPAAGGILGKKRLAHEGDQESTSEQEQDLRPLRITKKDEAALESSRLRKQNLEGSGKKRGRSIPPRHPHNSSKTGATSGHDSEVDGSKPPSR